jgi:DNA invertase Pin-like site-specific DNA recombinase
MNAENTESGQALGRLIGYARVSTSEQDTKLQFDALTRAGCGEIHREQGVSGTVAAANRPVLGKLLSALQPGDTLVVWRLDRLGRSMIDLEQTITALKDRGVGFKSVTESIDTTTAVGKMVFQIMGAFAEFERNLIAERTKAGLQAVRDRGQKLGPARKMPDERLDRAIALIDQGVSIKDVVQSMSVDETTVSAIFYWAPNHEPIEVAAKLGLTVEQVMKAQAWFAKDVPVKKISKRLSIGYHTLWRAMKRREAEELPAKMTELIAAAQSRDIIEASERLIAARDIHNTCEEGQNSEKDFVDAAIASGLCNSALPDPNRVRLPLHASIGDEERPTITVTKEEYDRVAGLVENPPEPSEGLVRLMKTHPGWCDCDACMVKEEGQ